MLLGWGGIFVRVRAKVPSMKRSTCQSGRSGRAALKCRERLVVPLRKERSGELSQAPVAGWANGAARVGEALVITFGQGKAARLVEVGLGSGELLEVSAGLDDGAIAGGGAGVEEVQEGGVIVGNENSAAVGSEAVGHGAGDKEVGRDGELIDAVLVAQQVGEAHGRIQVRAIDRIIAAEAGVKDSVVELVKSEAADGIGALAQDDGLGRERGIGGDTAVDDGLGEGEIARSDHHGQEGIGGGGIRAIGAEDRLRAGVGVRARGGEVAGSGVVTGGGVIGFEAVEERGGGAVDTVGEHRPTLENAVGNVHRENDEIDLAGQLAGGQGVEQRVQQMALEVAIAPIDIAAGPIDTEEVLSRDMTLFAVVVAQLEGVGAVLVDDDHNVEAAATGEAKAGGEEDEVGKEEQTPEGEPAPRQGEWGRHWK